MKPEDHIPTSPASTTDLQFQVFDTLSDEEKQEALQRAEQIPDNPQKLLFYGTRVQERLLEQSQQMMKYVEKKDIDQIGDVLEAFLHQLHVVEPDDLLPKKQGFFRRYFGGRSVLLRKSSRVFNMQNHRSRDYQQGFVTQKAD